MSEDVVISALGILDSYKYLGLLERDTIKDSQIKSMITAMYKQRARKVLKSSLNGKNVITAVAKHLGRSFDYLHSWNCTLDTD